MNKNLLKVGFYLFSFILLSIAITLVIEFRYMSEEETRDINFEEPLNSVGWLLIVALLFELITEILIVRDWIKTKRIPAYTLLIAFLTFILICIALILTLI